MRFFLACALILIWPFVAVAQDDDEDRGFLVGLLESSLGGEGRTVRIDGFAGALSSRATIDRITIADSEGVWLTLDEVAMQWNRSALFRAAIDIEELRAARIDLSRLPVAAPNEMPAPEAAPFSLPELPASISIGQLELDEVLLGETVLGEAANFTVSGSAELAGGAGNARINATRTDGVRGVFDVTAAYANDSRALTLDLGLTEGEAGLISGLLNIPDRPSVDLTVLGDGALDDFNATLDLRTDDTPRLAGTLALQSEVDGPMAFDVAMDGDVSALFLPEYRDFFGRQVGLTAQGRSDADGALSLDQFALETRALRLAGQANLNSDAWPTLLDIEGELVDPGGAPVRLPGAAETTLARALLDIEFDADQSDALSARITATDLEQAGTSVDEVALTFDGSLSGAVGAIGAFSGRLDVTASGLELADPAVARAVGSAVTGGLDIAYADEAPLELSQMSIAGGDWTLSGQAIIDGFADGFETRFDTGLVAGDLSAFADLAGLALDGAGDLSVSGSAALGGFFDIEVQGQTRDLAVGIPQADTLLAGETDLLLAARRDTTGTFVDRLTLENAALDLTASADLRTGASEARFNASLADVGQITDAVDGPLTLDGTATQTDEVWDISAGLSGPLQSTATGTARVDPDRTRITLDASADDIAALVPQIAGGIQLTAEAEQADGVWEFETDVDGPAGAQAAISGLYDGTRLTARYDIEAPELAAFAPGVPGGAALNGDVRQTDDGWAFDTQISGPYASEGTVSGRYEEARLAANFDIGLPNVGAIAPGITGPLALDGTLTQTSSGWEVIADVAGPYSSTGEVSATLDNGVAAARYALRLPNVAPLVPGLSGGASVDGTLQQVGSAYDIDAQIAGPSGTTATAAGRIQPDGTLNITSQGQLQLGLANPFIAPRTIIGTAAFDLAINGRPALSSVSGQITTQGARVATPNLPLSISNLTGDVRLSGGQAALNFTAQSSDGGNIGISGPITLNGGYPAQLAVALNSVVLRDPSLYSTTLEGQVNLQGPLTGGAAISGQINLGETNVQVPSTGISTFGSVPDITHIGATRPVMRTRDRAGLSETEGDTDSGAAFPLDLTINAPNRIFIRGRGLDAELGGQLRLSGTTADIISTGQFDLIRGRLNILAQRFVLDEGRVTLQGRFEPILLFVVETDIPAGTARIIVEGPADDPEVSFESTPDGPEDQVLAQIIFGRDISQLSAFQALQLASAVASLAGAGGEGIVSQLRGSFGLDDLDVSSDEDGNTAVRAGRYLSENVYTDVTVGGKDGPEVSLNIDLTPNITARGTVGADANTGVGIFIEKDY
ncbi:translocation/assembly module TamB domain-containing protein [uncultured Tateyamaria sp.]|uniref:translocation/assembly module TamB domain-containing protein n=1 Tax=uncultured Tateyamaria sp. TaxID=455651 RepID=UPI00262E01E3|nr:translocation/assembly module TamB domain-containing protein [uncultured Tateyamaria sp.]